MTKEADISGDASQKALLVSVGKQIRSARLDAKLRQSDLAASMSIGQAYIVGVEAGETNISLKTLVKFAEALGVSPVTLLVEDKPAVMISESALQELNRILEEAMDGVARGMESLRQARALVSGRTKPKIAPRER